MKHEDQDEQRRGSAERRLPVYKYVETYLNRTNGLMPIEQWKFLHRKYILKKKKYGGRTSIWYPIDWFGSHVISLIVFWFDIKLKFEFANLHSANIWNDFLKIKSRGCVLTLILEEIFKAHLAERDSASILTSHIYLLGNVPIFWMIL